MAQSLASALKTRLLQGLAMKLPGGMSLRPALHRWRGVGVGKDVWIGQDVLLETAYPHLISIGDRSIIGLRAVIIGHFHEVQGVRIGDDVFIGPCAVVLPGVTIGSGSVVAAGSVVTSSVPAATMVQGNPAKAVARCGIPLGFKTRSRDFAQRLRKL